LRKIYKLSEGSR